MPESGSRTSSNVQHIRLTLYMHNNTYQQRILAVPEARDGPVSTTNELNWHFGTARAPYIGPFHAIPDRYRLLKHIT